MRSLKLDHALGLLNSLEFKLNRLRCTWPCGIRSIDDFTDEQIKRATKDLEELKPRIASLRAEQRRMRDVE